MLKILKKHFICIVYKTLKIFMIFDDLNTLQIPKHFNNIYFGMGCFWGAEKAFWDFNGVYTTIVGYSGGITTNPTYEDVCTGKTGHAEIVKVIYDADIIKLKNLLKVFWESHDPTQLDRQGNDIGSQYRSAIYCENLDDLKISKDSKNCFQKILDGFGFEKIQTEITMLKKFYYAEDNHQKYLHKNPNGYCGLSGLGLTFKF